MQAPEAVPTFPELAEDVSWSWRAYDAERWDEWTSWLSEDERRSLQTYGSEKRRVEFVLGRAAARDVVAVRTGMAPRDVSLLIADDGAVEVGGESLHLSISHANGWATAALSPRPVGMDMERLTQRGPGVYRYFLSKSEYHYLEGSELDHDRLQILLWSVKEAVLKGTRTGLRVSPRDLRIKSLSANGVGLVEDREGSVWRLSWVYWRECYLAIADREN